MARWGFATRLGDTLAGGGDASGGLQSCDRLKAMRMRAQTNLNVGVNQLKSGRQLRQKWATIAANVGVVFRPCRYRHLFEDPGEG